MDDQDGFCGEDAAMVTVHLSGEVPDLSSNVHHLPCCIKHTGPCPVSHYFKPKRTGVVVDDLRVEEAAFRGRKLLGTTLTIPHGYSGYVLEMHNGQKEKAPKNEGESNCWKARATFQNFTYWNHDSLPSQDDAFVRCFHWFPVANALHKPVEPDELASATRESQVEGAQTSKDK
ncbi:ribonuclease H2 subunit C [Amborella trichopoda]|uniref:ribonuclease H2 subunit C n=1 Tax=Amborella trichopoda TaxID=13333 RepID=UPI0005D31A5E|nr:ribonuclease H2 subunit C [Amborella trichopoda]XP_020528485.1 ribonuclease H2 subunit C [Amborella trichopoda]|eukprot:XP_011626605.1 ribonuclease H2 subunit C [Amborella trichopoda]